MHTRPNPDEAFEYYWVYINQVEGDDVLSTLARQTSEVLAFAKTVTEERSTYRYAPGKWSIREVLNHMADTERAFAFRALWFARGFTDPLPGYDQNIAIAGSGANNRPWASHVEDFVAVRAATMTLFQTVPAEAWSRRGIASGKEFSVRAMAYIAAGHVAHDLRICREKYS